MKKYIFAACLGLLSLGFTSCDVETDVEAGGTQVEKMAGFWDVTCDAVNENGEIVSEDPYELGVFSLMTYNTAANSASEMWIDDLGNFWDFKMKVDVNYAARTFACAEKDYDADGSGKAVITDGRILEKAAKNVHGMPVDSIVFNITFSDDDKGLIYRIHGKRYWGTSPDVE